MKKLALFILCAYYQTHCFAVENVFYALRYHTADRMTKAENTFASLKKNYKKIDILIPQAFKIDANGIVSGNIEEEILTFAKSHSMRVMPLVTNAKFSKEISHVFLSNEKAEQTAIQSLVDLCEKNQFYGLQLDFEMVAKNDKDKLTLFYQNAANALHQHRYKVSFAVAPVVADPPQASIFLTKIYDNWEAAYDLPKLGQLADFVSIMAYNQHAGITTPGPTASFTWTEQTVKHALKYIPAEKISIGIPAFSTYWHTGTDTGDLSGRVMVRMQGVDFEKASKILAENKAKTRWDNDTQLNYSIFEHNWLNEYLFIENEASFKAKNALVKKYHLRGISVFDLGTEDPKIWDNIHVNHMHKNI